MINMCGNRWFESNLTVSIIIPTSNSKGIIARCLQSVKSQIYSNIETIVVDKYSRDGTPEVAEKFNARVLLRNSERSAARNYAAENAKGCFLFFIDSDMELTPKVVEECVAACLQKSADAIIIPERYIGRGFLAECRKIEKTSYVGDEFLETPRFFKKEVFNSVGGFDESLTFGEDSDLFARIKKAGYKTVRVRVKIRHHEGDLSMRKIALKAHHYGKSLWPLVRKNPSLALKKYHPVRLAYVRNAKLLFKDPIHFIGLILIKLIEYTAYLSGVFAYFLGV